jgi:hypothetical protein
MSLHIRRVLVSVALVFVGARALAVDFGRTEGAFNVTPAGAASYSIPVPRTTYCAM